MNWLKKLVSSIIYIIVGITGGYFILILLGLCLFNVGRISDLPSGNFAVPMLIGSGLGGFLGGTFIHKIWAGENNANGRLGALIGGFIGIIIGFLIGLGS